jgi:hypothetical protein
VVNFGYRVELISGYEFDKAYIFNEYVDYFHEIKANTIGAARFIAKMHLNQLYGYFGRKLNLIASYIVHNHELLDFVKTRLIKSIYEIDKDRNLVLSHVNVNNQIIKNINLELNELDINIKDNDFSHIKSNVAIAAATTAYARMAMIEYKTLYGEHLCYTDTDSGYFTIQLPTHLVGKELGLMKQELNGNIITKAYFLGIKQYGYQYVDKITGKTITNSVFAGVQRNTLTFNEIIKLANGETLTKKIDARFYKSLNNLNIKIIKDIIITIKQNNNKTLINNRYVPKHLNLNHELINNFSKTLISKLIYFINKIKNF